MYYTVGEHADDDGALLVLSSVHARNGRVFDTFQHANKNNNMPDAFQCGRPN